MAEIKNDNLQVRFKNAVDSFVDKIKDDPNIIAVLLKGSLSYDTVWEKSDVDTTVIIRDQNITTKSYCIDEDNITINVDLITRSNFVRMLGKLSGGSMMHSVIAKGTMIFSKDESLITSFEEYKQIGERDMELSIFYLAGEAISVMHKAEKWIKVKHDLTYARYYLIYAAVKLACIEVCANRIIPTREAILQADELNSALMQKFYHKPLSGELSELELYDILEDMDRYLMTHIDKIINVVTECLGDGEIKTVTAISNYYKAESHFIVNVFEYLYDKGIIEKLSQTIRITPKSKLSVEEMAFMMFIN